MWSSNYKINDSPQRRQGKILSIMQTQEINKSILFIEHKNDEMFIYAFENLTRWSQDRTKISRRRETKNAGKAARIAKLISFALRIWSSSSIALLIGSGY